MTPPLRFDPTRLGLKPRPQNPLRSLDRAVPSPVLIRPAVPSPATARRRTKIWELAGNLHCSIIGTCLSAAELRQLLTKVKLAVPGASDHDLHAQGVLLAGRRDGASKLLNKALDQRHRPAIKQFDAAESDGDVRALWRAAVQRGEIPGAYWAALSHPATSNVLARELFGEVHMLSHLVGAANRADIRRLCQLEADKADLEAKITRQQAQLRAAVVSRDATIAELRRALAKALAEERAEPPADGDAASEHRTLTTLVADLERRLAAETLRRERAENRAHSAAAEFAEEHGQRVAVERQNGILAAELDGLEASLAVHADPACEPSVDGLDLAGMALLYVGGRPNQLAHLRALGERLGAEFLHHDGGVEDRGGLLPGLVSRADLVMFPVDCVSHDAALLVKRLCRQGDKPFVPLRSAGLSSFLAALGRSEVLERRSVLRA